ncbi:MAG TPA: GNAT family N-acetyltransferase [Stellaceae bacterium]|nr:GNAT family N-acetyltransferase [Stellaceae bacterium]
MRLVEDTVTYLEMRARPSVPRVHPPPGKLALIRAEACSVSFYRYLYAAVGEKWLWYVRREWDDQRLAALLEKPTTEIFVLHVGGVPAGYFELNAAEPRETELSYFGLIQEFIGRGLGQFLLQQAVDRAWSRPLDRLRVNTCTFDHPRALPNYQRAGFVVYDRRNVSFQDPRVRGVLPRSYSHPLLPEFDAP